MIYVLPLPTISASTVFATILTLGLIASMAWMAYNLLPRAQMQ